MTPFDFVSRTRVVFGTGSFEKLGALAHELGFRNTLLVADRGMISAGYVARAIRLLDAVGIDVHGFHEFDDNPDSAMVETGRRFAEPLHIDSIIGLGGGSSMDCAKGMNFVLTNGGRIQDYWGYGKAGRPMLPSIGIPTTTGTGSEAQSYALISDSETHVKMACGDPKAAFAVTILDPLLCISQPRSVFANSGYDALSHAVETFVTTKRNAISDGLSREAWRLLSANFERAMQNRQDVEAMSSMLAGAHLAGMAIENSMLGATHACANPLTARYGTVHGTAIAVMLPPVVRWNQAAVNGRYAELHPDLPARLKDLRAAAGLPDHLSAINVPKQDLPGLAEQASRQWTGQFNPRPFDAAGALEVYECAYS